MSIDFDITKATDAEAGLQAALSVRPDLIMLDLKLQKNTEGLDLCELLGQHIQTSGIPVVIYSGSDDPDKLAAAFAKGAQDFIAKSASAKEVIARVQAKIRKSPAKRSNLLRFGNLVLDCDKMEVSVNQSPITMSVLEFHLLRYFVLNRDRVISRQEILKDVWQGSNVSFRTIDTHMVYLRKKLHGFDHVFGTVYGAGYILRSPA